MLRRSVWVLFAVFVGVAAFAAVRAVSFLGKPFPGVLIYPNGMVTMFGSDEWPGVLAGLDAWDVITRVDGERVGGAGDILERVRAEPVGTVFRYTIVRGKETLDVDVPSIEFSLEDLLTEPIPFLLTGVVYAVAGVSVYAARPSWATFGFATFGLVMGAALLRVDFLVGGIWAQVLQPMQPLIPAALIHLTLVFPERPRALVARPAWLLVPYSLALVLGIARIVYLYRDPIFWNRLDQATFVYGGLAIGFLVVRFFWLAIRGATAVIRERARAVVWGLLPAILVASAGGLLKLVVDSRAAISLLPLAGAWVWLGFLAYAAVKRNIFDFEVFVRRTVLYGFTAIVGLGAYAIALGISWAALTAIGYPLSATIPFLAVAFAVPLIPGVFWKIQGWMESSLFPRRVELVETVRKLSSELSGLMDTGTLVARVEQAFRDDVGVATVRLFVRERRRWKAWGVPGGGAPPPRQIGRLNEGRPVTIDQADLEPAAARWMETQGYTLLLPLTVRSKIDGFLALGEMEGGRMFNSEDVDILQTIASRMAIALANAGAVDRIRSLEERLREENRALREELELHPGFPEIIGASEPMKRLFHLIDQVAETETTVLIEGETGTGKELVAQAIHARSRQRNGPLVKVNCSAIPDELLEAELFGHEKGAFTDAVARRRGRFELASGGTLFFDEVGEIPIDLQAKLLRVLQDREFERVGGTETLRVTARVIAATNRDLREEVAAGRFREDLYFRLGVFPVRVPALRERREDISELVAHFLEAFRQRLDKPIREVPAGAIARLEQYHWPGNVRELENVLERAVVLSSGDVLEIPDLGGEPVARGDGAGSSPGSGMTLAESLRTAKTAVIRRALDETRTQSEAAALLGLRPSSLSRMLRDLGLR